MHYISRFNLSSPDLGDNVVVISYRMSTGLVVVVGTVACLVGSIQVVAERLQLVNCINCGDGEVRGWRIEIHRCSLALVQQHQPQKPRVSASKHE